MKAEDRQKLLHTLQSRFEKNADRHRGITWDDVLARLERASAAWMHLPRWKPLGASRT